MVAPGLSAMSIYVLLLDFYCDMLLLPEKGGCYAAD